MILEIILFCILSYTLSSIIVQQKIFDEPRAWLKTCSTENPSWLRRKICQLISCMFCTGFWSGIGVSLFLGFNVLELGAIAGLLNPVFCCYFLHGLLGAFGSYTLHLLMGMLIKMAEKAGLDT